MKKEIKIAKIHLVIKIKFKKSSYYTEHLHMPESGHEYFMYYLVFTI
jgi:hypothetical protein